VKGCICVFAKLPRPGTVKTRPRPAITDDQAQELARAFFHDTWLSLRQLPWAVKVLATTEHPDNDFELLYDVEVWLQGNLSRSGTSVVFPINPSWRTSSSASGFPEGARYG